MTEIPDHLESTYRMIYAAFPSGITDDEYEALIKILYDELSDRNLADVLAYILDIDPGVILNNIYQIASSRIDSNELNKVKKKLLPCGYEAWLAED